MAGLVRPAAGQAAGRLRGPRREWRCPPTFAGDLGVYRLARDPAPATRHDEIYKARLLLSYEVARHFSFFAGGGIHIGGRGDDHLDTAIGPEICGGLDL